MSARKPIRLLVTLTALFIVSCGGSGGSSTSGSAPVPAPVTDNSNPTITISTSAFTIDSGGTFSVTVSATDNVRVAFGPSVDCTNGGTFANNVFTAPTVSVETQSVCTVTASDAAGNSTTETFTATILAEEEEPIVGAPSISFKVNEAVVFEDGFIIIDAEDSSGGSSSIDTIDIVQTSGPEAKRLSNRNHLHWLYLAPDFDIDTEEVISFEITATNYGGLTTREAFDVTVIGRSGEGTIVGQYDPPLDLLVGTGPSTTTRMSYETVIAKQPASESFNAGKEELKFPGASYPGDSFTKVDYSRERIIQSEELFNDIASIERGFMGLFSVFADSLSIMNQVDNRLDWVVLDDQNITGPDEEDDRQFRLYDSIDIESPCFLAPIISRPQDFVLIGQKDVGFSIVKLTEISNEEGKTRGFDTETILTFGEGRSFCHFLQIGTRGQLPNEDFRLPWLLAVDYNSNDLVLLSYSTEDESYEINEIIPLDTGTDKTLKVVKAYSKGSPSQSPRAMIILLADDTHDGNHRLILYAQDSQTRQFVQTSIDLGDGIPSELLIGNYGGTRAEDQFAEDLVVIKRTSSTAEFFDDIGTNTMTTVDNPIFVKAGEFEVGEGVGSAVSVEHRATGTSLEQILLSFPETGELRLVTVDPENDPEVDPYR